MKMQLTVNGQQHQVDVDPSTPLLWVVRDHLQLTGTKYGCGMAQCGACTVYVDDKPIRSCVTPAASVQQQAVTTIEGLSAQQATPQTRAVQSAWNELAVVQCGYCQSGQVMSAAALLTENANPSDQDIDQYMSGNICRCATYKRIRDGIKLASRKLSSTTAEAATHPRSEGIGLKGGEEHVG